ncbi:hypothetical protein CRP01_37315 [Flavilitoribacter nigricans DSM 23189 = NBRC 102662]|uniref:SGNH hydrolase-type esterase domain-containing protein n=1 Tax=Flavilitoribacter nigricans (strain ATCC 23147 / DSM 23189 / NBRC 102662 / NCIMB 1420 / SS-2) TaxID=1122177 RepID=A0A2D0MZ91_FLAN2|nr:hypothetical protein CRP01_37315 [Flavilitoribacter nigricans DSM 23189 = NBRC 102662]
MILLIGTFGWGCKNTNMENLDPNRFEEEIVEFERENQYKGAPTGAIVFLGGAHIKNWSTLSTDFTGMPVKNRAFGDATLRENIHYFRRLLDPFQAEVLVMNAGASDIVLNASAEDVLKSFNDFVQQIVISNRASRLVYISIFPSPDQISYWPEMKRANELIKAVADQNPRIEFVDVTQEFIGSNGQPIEQMFDSDGSGLNQAGYARLHTAIAPVVERMF